MIKIENLTVHGFEEAIRGMRNPMNSWDKSDSYYTHVEDVENPTVPIDHEFHVGEADKDLMMRLANGGPVHAKYRRMITVYMDITAPLYWWKEFDTYKVGTVRNSCSTMHKIHEKEFTLEDFSCDQLMDINDYEASSCLEDDFPAFTDTDGLDQFWTPMDILKHTIAGLNFYRNRYLEVKNKPMKDNSKRPELMKKYWWQMIQLLPSTYNQRATVMLNYETLAGIYRWRKDHKLDEWQEFCKICAEELPHSEVFAGQDLIVKVANDKIITLNEARKMFGLEPLKSDVEGFKDYIIKHNMGFEMPRDDVPPLSIEIRELMKPYIKAGAEALFECYMKELSEGSESKE